MSIVDSETEQFRISKKEFARKLEKRARAFAVSIIKLSAKLPNTPEGRAIRTQITKSGTSVGANYREANRSRSKPDFRHKIKKECEECAELLAIFTSIGKKSS